MKKITYLCMMACLAVALAFQSCDDGDGYSMGDFTEPQLATVRAVSGTGFYLDCDVWGTCWPVNTDMGWYIPIDGQRVVTVVNPLWDNYGGFDHAVKILEIQNVLTKYVETVTTVEVDTIANDVVPVAEDGITITNGYLNVFFLQRLPFTTDVRLIYVKDDLKQTVTPAVGEDGFYHLELRCNTQADVETPGTYSMVSYSLNELNYDPSAEGIKLKVNLEGSGEQELTFHVVQEEGTSLQE